MDFRGQTEPNRVFGVVSDGARRYRVKRREEPKVFPSIVGGTADFDKNSSPTEHICRGLFFSKGRGVLAFNC